MEKAVDQRHLIEFVRERGLAVIASRSLGGEPQTALIGVAGTDRGEIVFDISTKSRKYRNIRGTPQVALVIGGEDEATLQCEGLADLPSGEELVRAPVPTSSSTQTGASVAPTQTSSTCA